MTVTFMHKIPFPSLLLLGHSVPQTHLFILEIWCQFRVGFRKLIVATGIALPNVPDNVPGIEHTVGYEDVSIDPDDFEGQSVLVLGMYVRLAARKKLRCMFPPTIKFGIFDLFLILCLRLDHKIYTYLLFLQNNHSVNGGILKLKRKGHYFKFSSNVGFIPEWDCILLLK